MIILANFCQYWLSNPRKFILHYFWWSFFLFIDFYEFSSTLVWNQFLLIFWSTTFIIIKSIFHYFWLKWNLSEFWSKLISDLFGIITNTYWFSVTIHFYNKIDFCWFSDRILIKANFISFFFYYFWINSNFCRFLTKIYFE